MLESRSDDALVLLVKLVKSTHTAFETIESGPNHSSNRDVV